jgi:DNA (cytosine-5)-methyltransferase 1
VGYQRAGFFVVGVDLKPQPNYPGEFHQDDALDFVRKNIQYVDAVHASPPCQLHSVTASIWRSKGTKPHPELIAPTRKFLDTCGKPWVIENVPTSPLIAPLMLCGQMFGLELYRHRFFETSFPIEQPSHPPHIAPLCDMGKAPKPGEYVQPVGHFSGVSQARSAMDIHWMTRDEMAQAIPPAYTEYVGKRLLQVLADSKR